MNSKKKDVNEFWKEIINEHNIINEIKNNRIFNLTSKEINKYKEARLMVKWDTSSSLPKILKENKIYILPIKRGKYSLSDFRMYQNFPEHKDYFNIKQSKITSLELPCEFDSLDPENITSEPSAINLLILSDAIRDFLELDFDDEIYRTIDGRMSSKEFKYNIEHFSKFTSEISVENSQCEIDAGFESNDELFILEAKNQLNKDFNIRQLYYPYRLWKNKTNKNIRLIYSLFCDDIFWLYEYKFVDPNNLSSIELVKSKQYTFIDGSLTTDELCEIYEKTPCEITDANEEVPFPQADSFWRLISLCEYLKDHTSASEEKLAKKIGFTRRQSGYYYNAGKYLKLLNKNKTDNNKIYLTKLGYKIFSENKRIRNKLLIEELFKHDTFNIIFNDIINNGQIPTMDFMYELLIKDPNIGDTTAKRRSRTLNSWTTWITNLTE